MRRTLFVVLAVGALWLVLSGSAAAQSGIAGVVKDTTGAVLPGVTVEASSPALIEKSRSVVTDADGQYKVIDLQPGTYSVTFTLAGFSTVRREGIELTASFTAAVNAEMKVGSIEESIVVSGATPIVDVQTTEHNSVLTRDVLDSLPTGRNYQTIGSVLPGMNMGRFDVGGSTAMQQSSVMTNGSLAGDMALLVDGMNMQSSLATGSTPAVYHNDDAYQEYTFQVSGGTAERQSAGVAINMIPREGSNQIRGDGLALFTNGTFQSSNVSADQRAHGVTLPAKLDKTWDEAASVGFPLMKDKLWWFSSVRVWGYNNFAPNAYNADGSQAIDDNLIQAYTNRMTYQISPKNKFTAMYDKLPKFRGHRNIETGLTDPQAAVVQRTPLAYDAQAKWTSTITSKLLLEVGYSEQYYNYTLHYEPGVQTPAQLPPYGTISELDIATGRTMDAAQMDFQDWFPYYNYVGSLSYVTGSHAFRAGIQNGWGWIKHFRSSNGDMVQEYNNGVPFQVIRWDFPILQGESDLDRNMGIFLQDSWTLRRLTLNPGLRYEIVKGSLPAQSAPAGRFVPARSFAPEPNLPNWKNWTPRFGAAYDLFGNGKTALKVSVGKYMNQVATGFPDKYNPLAQGSDTVTWTDRNHDNIAEDNELGPANNAALGKVNINPDPGIKRPFQVLYNAGVQQQLLNGLSVSVNYYRREYHDITYTENLAAPLTAYTLVNVPDPRGNGQLLPVYSLNPAFLGLVNNLDVTSPNDRITYNGGEVTMNGRGRNGATVAGGVSVGRTISIQCDVPNPNMLRFCDQSQYSIPLATTLKLAGSYPVPYGFRVSGVLQTANGFGPTPTVTSGPPDSHDVLNTYVVTHSVLPTLTQSSVSVLLDPPGSNWMPRVTQLDLSVARTFRVTFGSRTVPLIPQVDVFNSLNANPVLTEVNTYGPKLGNPATILSGRLVRFQLRVNF